MRPAATSQLHNSAQGSFKSFISPQSLFRASARAAGPAVIVAMSSAGAAAAKGAPAYPPKVQAVLDHLQHHPMTVTSSAMQYDAEPTTPLPECIQGLSPSDVISSGGKTHMASVIAGLLYAACGGLDQAHNLVTPLCWGSWTPYGGKPVANSPAAAEAAYVHAIVHRQEGQCIGEFGSGFSNANYWYKAAGDHPISQELFKAAQKLAAGKPLCEAHVSKHGSSWSPTKFVSLCDQVASSKEPELRSFCEGVMATELQLLLKVLHHMYDHI